MADTQAKKFLDALWASGGDRAVPSFYNLEREGGWDVRYEQLGVRKYPERRLFNQLLREIQGAFSLHMKRGVLPWDVDINYAQHAFVAHDNHLWWSAVATGPASGNATEPGTNVQVWKIILRGQNAGCRS